MKFPFSVYDFLSYIAAGLLIIVSLDYALNNGEYILFTSKESKSASVLIISLLSYIFGHVNSQIAYFLYERIIMRKILGPVENTLFEKHDDASLSSGSDCKIDRSNFQPTCKFLKVLFPGYFKPLEDSTQTKICQKTGIESDDGKVLIPGRNVFNQAFHSVKENESTKERLDIFLNVYSFCRNVSLASLIAAGMILANASTLENLYVGSVLILCSIILLYRYLGFYRYFTVEVFRSFAFKADD